VQLHMPNLKNPETTLGIKISSGKKPMAGFRAMVNRRQHDSFIFASST
jgi:hypothetical protein